MAKTRVHEIAKEFGVGSNVVLDALKAMDVVAEGGSSTIELPDELVLRRRLYRLLAVQKSGEIPPLTWPLDETDYDGDLLVDVAAGTVVLLVRGRNAWRSTWVRHYLRNATLYKDVRSAKAGAESQRGPGNVFYIVEAPALLLSGERNHVVLCDAHPNDPFGAFTGVTSKVNKSIHGSWIDGLYPGVSVRDAAAAFRHTSGHWSGPTPSEHSLRTGRLDSAEQFDTGSRELQSLVSRPIGSKHKLQWDPSPNGKRYSWNGTRTVARRWSAIASGVDQQPSDVATRATRFAAYRNEVLQAVPLSQWLAKKARTEAKRKALKDAAHELWEQAQDRADELESALWDAETERDAARGARLTPATSSAGVRAQRERFESAVAEFDRIQSERERAESEAAKRWDEYSRI